MREKKNAGNNGLVDESGYGCTNATFGHLLAGITSILRLFALPTQILRALLPRRRKISLVRNAEVSNRPSSTSGPSIRGSAFQACRLTGYLTSDGGHVDRIRSGHPCSCRLTGLVPHLPCWLQQANAQIPRPAGNGRPFETTHLQSPRKPFINVIDVLSKSKARPVLPRPSISTPLLQEARV